MDEIMEKLSARRERFEAYREQLSKLCDEERELDQQISQYAQLLNKFNDFSSTLHGIVSQLDDNKIEIKEKSALLLKAQLPANSATTEQDDEMHDQNRILKKLIDERKHKEKLVNEKKFAKPLDKSKYMIVDNT